MIMQIGTVKELLAGGWLVNGSLTVPNDGNNADCTAVKAWIADGNTPDPADPVPPKRVLTYAEFKARFTSGEMAQIVPAVHADAAALNWTLDATADNSVSLDSDDCIAFLDKMVLAGIITEDRKTEIRE